MKESVRLFVKRIGILSLFFLLLSCVIGRYSEGPLIPQEKIKEIKPGVTTKAEIISWFGPPQNYISPTIFNEILREMDVTREPLTNYPFANILSYQYNRGNIRAIVLVLFNFVEANVKSDHLVIFLDEKDRVKYYGFRNSMMEISSSMPISEKTPPSSRLKNPTSPISPFSSTPVSSRKRIPWS